MTKSKNTKSSKAKSAKPIRIVCDDGRAIDILVERDTVHMSRVFKSQWGRTARQSKWVVDPDAGIAFDRALLPQIIGALALADEEAP